MPDRELLALQEEIETLKNESATLKRGFAAGPLRPLRRVSVTPRVRVAPNASRGSAAGRMIALVLLAVAASWATSAGAEEAPLLALDGGGRGYGASAALDAGRAIVGARSDSPNAPYSFSGSAYVFAFDGSEWAQTQKLIPSDAVSGDVFGSAVAIDGDRILVGAPGVDDYGSGSGAVYVFDRDGAGWHESAKLRPADGAAEDRFGDFGAVALDGDRALIGAVYDDDRGSSSGSAYVFEFDGADWVERAKLLANDGGSGDLFGESVALDGDRALVGAPHGIAAYIFEFDGTSWYQTARLSAGAAFDENFGFSVALDGDRAFVGSHTDGDNGPRSGSVYVFETDGSSWSLTTKLVASDGAENDTFGFSLSLEGDRALIGAPGKADFHGSTYVFEYDGTTWQEREQLEIANVGRAAQIGFAVSLSGTKALVGMAGAASVFTLPDLQCSVDRALCEAGLATCEGDLFEATAALLQCDADLSLCGADLSACDGSLSVCSGSLSVCNADLSACDASLAQALQELAVATADDDADGVRNTADACPGTAPAADIDALGCSAAQFCGGIDASTGSGRAVCSNSDWKNDEPLAENPEDCRARQGVCEPR